ncbi:peptidase domain protein [Gloeothece citriformis PCC 7424]|uniref:Peptidase domain protein n=1 Tax=Gloeothece citriformis (strain PCC 7424) TaxID=65393 RepID=B7KCS3_GLOC7|nr:peptidase domain protein [Gloeothece citriformis PCC 7424]
MKHSLGKRWYSVLFLATSILTIGYPLPIFAQKLYSPLPLPNNNQVSDTLTDQDIPTGEGGFARDYFIDLDEGDQVAVDLISDDFDAIVILMASDGSTIAENDDGPDGSTNSLLFTRITERGRYIIRVRAFGETGSGNYTLKVTRLRPVN